MKDINILRIKNPFRWTKPMSWLASIIRWAIKENFNHMALLIKIDESFYVIQAVWPRATIMTYENWKNQKVIRNEIQIESIDNIDVIATRKKALEEINKPYDWFSLFILQPIKLITGRWLGKTAEWAYNRVTCSELVARVLNLPDAYKAIPFK